MEDNRKTVLLRRTHSCAGREELGAFSSCSPNLSVLGQRERDTADLWKGGAETQLFPTDQTVMILERLRHLLCIYRSL